MPARHIAPPVVDELELPVQQESYYSMYANDVGSVRLAAPPGHRCSSEVVTALRSSPILVPNSIDEDDDWDHSDDVSEYRSPALKIGAAKNFVGGNGAEHQTGSSAGGAAAAERCSKQLEHRSNAPPGKDGLYYSKNPRKVEYRCRCDTNFLKRIGGILFV